MLKKNSWQKYDTSFLFCLKSWKSTDTVFCLQTYRTWRQMFLQSRVRAPQRDWSRFYPHAPPHCFLLRNRKSKNKERKTKCSSSLRWRSNSDFSPPVMLSVEFLYPKASWSKFAKYAAFHLLWVCVHSCHFYLHAMCCCCCCCCDCED